MSKPTKPKTPQEFTAFRARTFLDWIDEGMRGDKAHQFGLYYKDEEFIAEMADRIIEEMELIKRYTNKS